MAKPAPLSPFGLTVLRVLSCCSQYLLVGESVLPLDMECILEASVYKGLVFVC